jgi:hypothetical protein
MLAKKNESDAGKRNEKSGTKLLLVRSWVVTQTESPRIFFAD